MPKSRLRGPDVKKQIADLGNVIARTDQKLHELKNEERVLRERLSDLVCDKKSLAAIVKTMTEKKEYLMDHCSHDFQKIVRVDPIQGLRMPQTRCVYCGRIKGVRKNG